MSRKISAKHLLLILPLLALVALIGYKVFQAVKAKSEMQQSPSSRPGGGGARTQNVQTGVVSTGTVSEKIALTGSLQAKESVDVMPRVQGRILNINVDTGQAVAKGALIAVLEDDEINQQIERAKAAIAVADASVTQREAEVQNAKAELDRKRKLVEEGVLSRFELDGLETRYRVTQSQLELARAQRRQSEAEHRELVIRQVSPITGIIANRQLDVGAMAGPSAPIVTIVSVNPMVIQARASEQEVSRIRRGASVKVTVDGLPGQQFTGRVMRIAPLLDPQTRNGLIEIEIPNRNGALKGEMFARAELDLGSQRETTLLPRDALVYRGDQPGVYTIESDTARFREVETGLTQQDKVEVLNGLKLGEVVVTRGSNLLKDGDKVKIIGGGSNSSQQPKQNTE